MMNDERIKQRVQQTFDTSLSGLREDPWLAQRVLHAADGKGDVRMKKKLSVSLILLAMLLLVTLTALAIGLGIDEIWNNSFNKMHTTGEIYTLSYPEQDDMTAEEAIALARRAIVGVYGTTDEEFERMGVYPTFIAHGYDDEDPDAPAEWRIYFSSRQNVNLDLDTDDYGPDGEYRVYINAETQEILFCNWYTNDFWKHAQRIWNCGSYDTVYWHYGKSDFFRQSAEQQAYWTRQLAAQGYQVRAENGKYAALLQTAFLDQAFCATDALLADDEPQAAAAWAALETVYGLDTTLMKQYAYGATRPDWNTGTEDIYIAFRYELLNMQQQESKVDALSSWVVGDVRRLGMFMVSFEPGSTDVVAVTHVLFSTFHKKESQTTGLLYEKNDWGAEELQAFDRMMISLRRALRRMEAAHLEMSEQEKVFRAMIGRQGGDARYYDPSPEGVDVLPWFAEESSYDAAIPRAVMPLAQAWEQYGRDDRFWPLEVQAYLYSGYAYPLPGEMTEQEAKELAVQAVVKQLGQEALTELGNYAIGCRLYRFQTEKGEATRWHIFITDNPETAENGWQVIFALRQGALWDQPTIQPIAEEGLG